MPRRPGRETARQLAEAAARLLADPAAAAARAHRGANLCRAVLAGAAVPDEPPPAPTPRRPAPQTEAVACAGCYRPVEGRPGSRCPDCRPQDLSDLIPRVRPP